jgi:hypothetical protein
MSQHPVVVFGAGATKACGGLMTNEILLQAFAAAPDKFLEWPDSIALVRSFVTAHFPVAAGGLHVRDYPPLPLFLSLLDTALDRKESFGPDWTADRLADVRRALDYLMFKLLDTTLEGKTNPYRRLLDLLWPDKNSGEPVVMSLNYDILLDLALFERGADQDSVPDYAVDFKTKAYNDRKQRYGLLLKLHGSLNWMYCPFCHRIDIGWSRKFLNTSTVAPRVYRDPDTALDEQYGARASSTRSECKDCYGPLQPILITPAYRKDYRNPHLARIWYEAQRKLRDADRVIFVGYSLPDDDVEVVYLLKRGLPHLASSKITVVEWDRDYRQKPRPYLPEDYEVLKRYRALFGPDIDFRLEGFQVWLDSHDTYNHSPRLPNVPWPPPEQATAATP